MKLTFKQKFFSFTDTYKVRDEAGAVVYTAKRSFFSRRRVKIFDKDGNKVGAIKAKFFAFLPTFKIYEGDTCIGKIKKKFSFFKPKFAMDCKDWKIKGGFFEKNYQIVNGNGDSVAKVSQKWLSLTNTYVMEVEDPANALAVLMVILAITSEKQSRN